MQGGTGNDDLRGGRGMMFTDLLWVTGTIP
ncbi:hypothetical protein [Candidatus Hamiltonella endosymbiont of Tuberolachnus salignus]